MSSGCSVVIPGTVWQNHKLTLLSAPKGPHQNHWFGLVKPERSNQSFSPKKGKSLSTICADQSQMCSGQETAVTHAQIMKLCLSHGLCRETGASERFFSEGLLIIIAWRETHKGRNKIVSLGLFCLKKIFIQQEECSNCCARGLGAPVQL